MANQQVVTPPGVLRLHPERSMASVGSPTARLEMPAFPGAFWTDHPSRHFQMAMYYPNTFQNSDVG